MNKSEENIKDGKRLAVQHGEVYLQPIEKIPEGETQKSKKFIVGHSETGHHHVLEADVEFEVMPGDDKHDLFVRLFKPAQLVHQKTYDIHETKTIVAGDYAIFQKTEYDPFADVVRAVYD